MFGVFSVLRVACVPSLPVPKMLSRELSLVLMDGFSGLLRGLMVLSDVFREVFCDLNGEESNKDISLGIRELSLALCVDFTGKIGEKRCEESRSRRVEVDVDCRAVEDE